MEFSKLKVYCSSISKLVGNPKGNTLPTEKEVKDFINWINKDLEKITPKQVFDMQSWILKHSQYNPKLLTTSMKEELARIYAKQVWGKDCVGIGGSSIKSTEKGSLAEDSAIQLLSKTDNLIYKKNVNLYESKYFVGIPDIVLTKGDKVEKIIEIKVCYDSVSFIEAVAEKTCDSDHFWQIQGYFDVTSCSNGEIVHVLVNMPESMIDAEISRMKDRDLELGVESSKTQEKIERMVNNMTYNEIPELVRIHRKPVNRNVLSIKTARSRVPIARRYLKEIHDKLQNKLNL